MRRFFCFFLLLITFLSQKELSALPIQNPSSPTLLVDGIFIDSTAPLFCSRLPQYLSLDFGYYGDFVFDRKLKTVNGDTVHKTEIFTNAGYLATTICNWVELFGTVGVTQMNIIADQRVLLGNNSLFSNSIEIETGSNFSWSGGAIVKLLEGRGWTIGVEGQYFAAYPHVKFTHQNLLLGNSYSYLNDATLHYWEAQGGGGISYRLDINGCSALIPYVGVKWSWERLTSKNVVIPNVGFPDTSIVTCTEDQKIGYAVGATLLAYGRGAITGEVRFLGETAANVTMKIRF